jgi:hypothetical protein
MAKLTLQEVNKMSASEYSKRMSDPTFIEEVNALMVVTAPIIDPETGKPIGEVAIDPETNLPAVPKTAVETVPSTAVLAPVENDVTPVEKRYEWQPTDENGKSYGGKQVIVYTTPDELTTKLTEQNNLILRRMRKLSRESKLGLTPGEDVPVNAPRTHFTEFKPKQLSADERFQLIQELNDPAKFEDAKIRLAEATFGARPEVITNMLQDSQRLLLEQKVIRSFDAFIDNVGDNFYNVEANRLVLTDWMCARDLAPTPENFEIALARTAALQLPAPVVQPSQAVVDAVIPTVESEPKAKVPAVADARISGEAQSVQTARHQTPSGLNDRVSSASGNTPVSDRSLTLADVDRMSADNYKKQMLDPAFARQVDQLYKEQESRRAARTR